MNLQDLLRNIVLYKGVIRPVLQSWKESLIAVYLKPNYLSASNRTSLQLLEAKGNGFRERGYIQNSSIDSTFSLPKLTGTRTISYFDLIPVSNSPIQREERVVKPALNSNILLTVLTEDVVDENAVNIGKPYMRSHTASTAFFIEAAEPSSNATTGYTCKKTYFLLNLETHEKREYLGEFSLTHEETPLLYFKKGGAYHETDKESAAAII